MCRLVPFSFDVVTFDFVSMWSQHSSVQLTGSNRLGDILALEAQRDIPSELDLLSPMARPKHTLRASNWLIRTTALIRILKVKWKIIKS